MDELLDGLKYDDNGLIPAVVQDHIDGQVLMVAYMNRESLRRTLEGEHTCFWSRSRQVGIDCDKDCLLVLVEQQGKGVACHTGERSCFFRGIDRQSGELSPIPMEGFKGP